MRMILCALTLLFPWTVLATQLADLSDSTQKETTYVISNKHVNRIVTPFKNPSIKMDSVGSVAYKSRDNVLYVSTTHNAPIAGFITESGDESAAIQVTFKPMAVGPQEVVLKGNASNGSSLARRFERSSPRSATITT